LENCVFIIQNVNSDPGYTLKNVLDFK